MQKSAFTLIELLVVIAILAAILFPAFAQAKLAAKATVAISNTKQIALSHILYQSDADDRYCPMSTIQQYSGGPNLLWYELVLSYTKNLGVFSNPLGIERDVDSKNSDKMYSALSNWGIPPRGITFSTYRAPNGANPGNWKFGDNARGSFVTGGKILVFDGIFSYAADGNYGGARITAPSRTGTEIANPSDTVLVCHSAKYHMGWADVGDEGYGTSGFKAFQYGGTGTGFPGNYFFPAPLALKNPKPGGAGYLPSVPANASQAANGIPDGMAIYAAADGSAKAKNWRATFTKGTPVSGTGYSTMDAFWPQGNG